MAVKIKEYAESMGLSSERLIGMLAEAELTDKTEDSELSDQEKRMLLMQLQKGRVRQVPKPSERTIIPSQVGAGAGSGAAVEIRGGYSIAKRPIITPSLTEADDSPVPSDAAGADLPEQVSEDTEPTAAEESEALAADQERPAEQAEAAAESAEAEVEDKAEEPDASTSEPAAEPVAEAEPAEPEKTSESAAQPVPDAVPPSQKKDKPKRRSGKRPKREQLHVVKGREKLRRERERKKRPQKLDERITQHTFQAPIEKIIHSVSISDSNSIRDLAQAMSVKVADVIKYSIEELELQVTINASVDRDTAILLVEGLGHIPVEEPEQDIESQLLGSESDDRPNLPRPPVVAVMGHVDHGKTTLLDSIRSTKVAASEKGGITQHIGAYMVKTPRGMITFLDTPGHEAFTAMRVRGARATDIVILVVAADDGVMPQTVEAINHARSAEVPIIVAINKIDKPSADPNKILRGLTEHEVIAESLGGDIQTVEISALKNMGIDDLLERIELQADLMDEPLTAPVEGIASGVVIEARVDKGRGAVVTVLVQKGTLTPKQIVVAGLQKGKVRQLTDYRGRAVKAAKPSTPIEITGFSKVPEVGDEFVCPPDDRSAQRLIEHRQLGKSVTTTGQAEFVFGESDGPTVINVVIKADVSGSAEALAAAVKNLSDKRVDIKVIHSMVGGISQSDVNLAIAANAMIVAFNVRAEATAKQLINENNLTVIYSGIIYEALDALKEAILNQVGPNMIEEVIAKVNVLEVFKFTKIGTVAGCYVEDGTVRNKQPVRVVRDNVIIHNGMIDSLRRFQNDVNEVRAGLECGIQLKNYHDIHIDDMLEIYQSREAG